MTDDKKCFKCGKTTYCHSIGDGVFGFDAPYLCMNCKENWANYFTANDKIHDNVTNEMWKMWFERWANKRVKHKEPLRSFQFR